MGRTKTKTAEQPTLIVDNGPAEVAVVQKGTQPVARINPGPDSLFAIIERAARDPSIDLSRMQELISMHKELKADNARAEYDAAMADAQAEMKTIKTNKANSQTHSRYATYEAMDKAIRPIYTRHGFAVTFNTGDAPKPDDVRVLCTVSHRSGHRQEYKLDVPADGKGAKGGEVMTRTHAAGSAISYGKRYLAGMVWNLSVGDDDDGNSAASIAERAKTMADSGITHLNTANLNMVDLEKYRTKQEKNIKWLQENAPAEFERFQTAYSNAAEAAGIKKEEPTRGDRKAQAKAAAVDLTDENATDDEPIVFEAYTRAGDFFIFADAWLVEEKRTEAELVAFGAFYADYMNERLDPKFKSEPVRKAMIDTKGLLTQALKRVAR